MDSFLSSFRNVIFLTKNHTWGCSLHWVQWSRGILSLAHHIFCGKKSADVHKALPGFKVVFGWELQFSAWQRQRTSGLRFQVPYLLFILTLPKSQLLRVGDRDMWQTRYKGCCGPQLSTPKIPLAAYKHLHSWGLDLYCYDQKVQHWEQVVRISSLLMALL